MTHQTEKPQISLDDKWDGASGTKFFSGTQAIALTMLLQARLDKQAGLNTAGFISGYRGSPLGNVDSTLWSIGGRLKDAGILFSPGVNEDLAATAVAGTQQFDQFPGARHDGVFAAWYGKGPGVDRSGDAFKHGNYLGAHQKGGVVIFYGDDHAGKSSTVAFQSEQAIIASSIPILYPSDPAEIVRFGLLAFSLSRYSGLWVSVKCVNEVVEQAGTFDVDIDGPAANLPPSPPGPPEGRHAGRKPFAPLRSEQIVNEFRLPLIEPFVRANAIDRVIVKRPGAKLGIVAAGKSYNDVRQAFDLLGLTLKDAAKAGLALYKLGCIWPIDGEGMTTFCEGLQTLFCVEEKKAFVETQIARLLVNRDLAPKLIGKRDEAGATILSDTLPLEPIQIAIALCDRMDAMGILPTSLRAASVRLRAKTTVAPLLADVRRAPFFCSGCPHSRSTRLPDGSQAMAGIGCHGMASFARPDENLPPLQMGAEGTNWIGIAPFNDTGHIFQNMGDGTYYHSGLLAIRAAVAAKVNITYKILYNDAVAMTGGQPVDGPLTVAAIAQQLRNEGVAKIWVLSDNPDYHRKTGGFPDSVNIGHRDSLDAVQRELRETSGCSILIYEQVCAAEKRRRRKRGTFPNPPKRMFIADGVCEGCGDCSEQSSCVSIMPKETALGRKRAIDQSSCNKDFSCNLGFCPSFITIHGAEPKKPEGVAMSGDLFKGLPIPRVASLESGSFNIMVAGIGGTGVITVGAMIGMAAHIEGKRASLFDMTGLAQKNGAVYSHIRIAPSADHIHAQRLGVGEADLLLGFDLVAALAPEAANSVAPGRTAAIVNADVVPTAAFQRDRDIRVEPEILLARLAKMIGKDAITQAAASDLALKLTGDTISANLMMVGMAAQLGLLPVGIAALEQAVRLNGVAVKLNLRALELGRLIVAAPERIAMLLDASRPNVAMPETLDEIVAHRSALLEAYQDARLAQRYRDRIGHVARAEQAAAPGSTILSVAVARAYARLLAIKDEYEVARLLTDPALHAEIRATFGEAGKIAFNMAPPFLGTGGPGGRPRKREMPGWVMLPALNLLKRLKGLRGGIFDPFGYARERRAERALLSAYEALLDRAVDRLSPANLDKAIALLTLANDVRGFGPVKMAAMHRYEEAVTIAEHAFEQQAVKRPKVSEPMV